MYNRILNRPMFKRGGDVMDAKGTGITSGLDTPRHGYHRGRVVRPGGYNGEDKTMALWETINKLKEQNIVTPKQKSGAFWEGISQFGGAKTLAEAVMRGVDAQSKAIEPYEKAVSERALALDKIGLTGQIETGLKEMGTDVQWKVAQLDAETQIEVEKMKENNKEKAIELREAKAMFDADEIDEGQYLRMKKEIISDINIQKDANALAIKLIAAGMSTKETAAEDAMTIILGIGEAMKALQASGGRVGYQLGTNMQGVQPQQVGFNQPTEVGLNVDETIKTPAGTLQEDISVQEKIQPSVNMTYEEFRAKMPPEVDDDIVQLIYYNEDAFADFAQIKTQDEVYSFNNKWGVTLVLPFNTEIT